MSRPAVRLALGGIARWNTANLISTLSRSAGARHMGTSGAIRRPVNFPTAFRGQTRTYGTRNKIRQAADSIKEKAGEKKDEVKEKAQSLGDRLKKLSKEYGWVALGVYLGLSALDFPFCFLLVRTVGTERIGHAEHVVSSAVATVIPESIKKLYREFKEKRAAKDADKQVDETPATGASLGAQLALAYAIHKSLIFIRVPVTAAVLPKVVRTLQRWGYNVGKKPKPNVP